MIGNLLNAARGKVLAATALLVVIVAVSDRFVVPGASLGLFYMAPVMLGATVLGPVEIVLLAVVCAVVRSVFDLPSPPLDVALRFLFATLAYSGSGFFVAALIRNRQLMARHVEEIRREQKFRRDAEERLQLLVESSPAAIFTTDADGAVLASNNAAATLFHSGSLAGKQITAYLPLLGDALLVKTTPEGFRAAAQCQGRRENGEIFLAQAWFSLFATPLGKHLAAIVVDVSEEMRDREEEGLRQLDKGNRIAVAAVSHEVRNLCSAISLLCSNLKDKHPISDDEDFQGLSTLVAGLERIAAGALCVTSYDTIEEVPLREVLDDLRIVIDPDWREIEGAVVWELASPIPVVMAERHGLFQALLNLAKNSHRAVQSCPRHELRIAVSVNGSVAQVRFQDTGPGIADPERLFQPFQSGADGAGLGLYLSRAVIRGFGGELCLEPQSPGTCFRVDLRLAARVAVLN